LSYLDANIAKKINKIKLFLSFASNQSVFWGIHPFKGLEPLKGFFNCTSVPK